MAEVVAAIEAAAPEVAGRITWADELLPFPDSLEATLLERLVGPPPRTPLAEGVRRTIEHFRRAGFSEGRDGACPAR
jgi:hypothetical protein